MIRCPGSTAFSTTTPLTGERRVTVRATSRSAPSLDLAAARPSRAAGAVRIRAAPRAPCTASGVPPATSSRAAGEQQLLLGGHHHRRIDGEQRLSRADRLAGGVHVQPLHQPSIRGATGSPGSRRRSPAPPCAPPLERASVDPAKVTPIRRQSVADSAPASPCLRPAPLRGCAAARAAPAALPLDVDRTGWRRADRDDERQATASAMLRRRRARADSAPGLGHRLRVAGLGAVGVEQLRGHEHLQLGDGAPIGLSRAISCRYRFSPIRASSSVMKSTPPTRYAASAEATVARPAAAPSSGRAPGVGPTDLRVELPHTAAGGRRHRRQVRRGHVAHRVRLAPHRADGCRPRSAGGTRA